jgi:hypothetical protein
VKSKPVFQKLAILERAALSLFLNAAIRASLALAASVIPSAFIAVMWAGTPGMRFRL